MEWSRRPRQTPLAAYTSRGVSDETYSQLSSIFGHVRRVGVGGRYGAPTATECGNRIHECT